MSEKLEEIRRDIRRILRGRAGLPPEDHEQGDGVPKRPRPKGDDAAGGLVLCEV